MNCLINSNNDYSSWEIAYKSATCKKSPLGDLGGNDFKYIFINYLNKTNIIKPIIQFIQ